MRFGEMCFSYLFAHFRCIHFLDKDHQFWITKKKYT